MKEIKVVSVPKSVLILLLFRVCWDTSTFSNTNSVDRNIISTGSQQMVQFVPSTLSKMAACQSYAVV